VILHASRLKNILDPQIDSNMLARPLQEEVAKEMISPSSQKNTVHQLNMGEGKSSVIVPFTAVSLADGRKLMRVVVPKPLSSQMFDLLVGRLSGLSGRRIFYMPFSRNVRASSKLIKRIQAMYEECCRAGGVLVVQPEHILSFQLMGLDYLMSESSEQRALAGTLWDSQRWVHAHARDVLDESDELLHSRYQLIYTVGLQQPFHDHPNRWTTTQQVLHLAKNSLEALSSKFPYDVRYDHRSSSGAFPMMRILSSESNVGDALTDAIVDRIMSDGALPNLNFAVLSSHARSSVREFMLSAALADDTRAAVQDACENSSLWPGVLLLRGLLSQGSGVLPYVLTERRWRVDFGLDPSRTMMAVPYRAKVSRILLCIMFISG
jgi:hypothetical protein